MPKINFNLKDQKTTNSTLIHLIFNYDGKRLKLSTQKSVPPKYWNDKTQRVKESREYPDHSKINNALNKQSNVLLNIYEEYRNEGISPTPEMLKHKFMESKDQPVISKSKKNLWHYYEQFIDYKREQLNDIRDYDKSLRKHLVIGEKNYGQPLTFSALKEGGGFVKLWDEHLIFEAVNSEGDYGLTTNTVGKLHKNLKVFLNWCFDNNYYSRFHLKHLPTVTEDVEKIYLKENELELLEAIKLDDPTEQTVRDLFLIGCETALRFSDFTRLSSDNYISDQLHFHPKKTSSQIINNKVIIPVSQRHQRILDKYNGIPPIFDGNRVSEFNKIIREVARKAGITDEQKTYKRIAEKTKAVYTHRYEEISSHTCRRTFCTLKFLKGMSIQAIMKFSGHRTERNFMKYLKLDAQIAADKYKEFF